MFPSHFYMKNGLFSCSPFHTVFMFEKKTNIKRHSEVPGVTEMRHIFGMVTSFKHFNYLMDQRATDHLFISQTAGYRVCEIKSSDMSKNNGNSDLVYKKVFCLTV